MKYLVMTPEGLNFINYLQEIPYKVRLVEYDRVYTNNVRISKVELRETSLNVAEIEMARYHTKNGCPEILISYKKGDDIPPNDVNEQALYDKRVELRHALAPKPENKIAVTFSQKELLEAEFSYFDESRLRAKLREEEARENYEMCAEILKYAESKGLDLNRE